MTMNGTLKRSADWQEANALVQAAGLQPYARSPAKAWDALRACNFVLANVSRLHPVLDVGGIRDYSHISRWLADFGFRVEVINPAFRRDFSEPDGKVRYVMGDATESHYPDLYFGAATCLSVIEHGIVADRLFREMRRILIPDGYLIVSTDFWCEPIDTGRRRCFGAPVTIFTAKDIRTLLRQAADHCFQPTGVIDYRCDEAAVHWLGLSYTFIDFALRKVE